MAREDALQRKLISILQGERMKPGEDLNDFFARRKLVAGKVATKRGKWSHRHIKRCLTWNEHLQRDRNAASWPAMLLNHRDADYLEALRALRDPAGRRRGTGTRTIFGAPAARWQEALRAVSKRI